MSGNNQVINLIKGIQILSHQIRPERYIKLKRILLQRSNAISLTLENLSDPLNGSAVLRTGESYSIQNFKVVETTDKFKQITKKNCNIGVDKWLSIKHYQHPKLCLEELKQQGHVILTSNLSSESKNIEDILCKIKDKNNNYPKLALLFGNEQRGLSKTSLNYSDFNFKLPMFGFSQSFNLNVSVGMSLSILEQYNVMRKKEYKPIDENDLLELNYITNFDNINDDDLLTTFWKSTLPFQYGLNYPLNYYERTLLLFKWLFSVTPNAYAYMIKNNIELDFL